MKYHFIFVSYSLHVFFFLFNYSHPNEGDKLSTLVLHPGDTCRSSSCAQCLTELTSGSTRDPSHFETVVEDLA